MDTKLEKMPETHTLAAARFASKAALMADALLRNAGDQVDAMFTAEAVTKIVVEEIGVEAMMAREIAELERDIAVLKLAKALAEVKELRAKLGI